MSKEDATKTALFSRTQPGGMFTIEDQGLGTGDRFYVGSAVTASADSVGAGRNPQLPFATLEFAIGQATASQGDIIYVMPGHVEDVEDASGLDIDKAGITIIGLGWGDIRPKIQLTETDATVEINGADIWIENLIFEGTIATGVVMAIDVQTAADDLTFKDCVFRGTTTDMELLIAVNITATNDRITFDGCEFIELVGTASAAIVTEGAFTNMIVKDCYFNGTWSAATLDLDAAAVTTQALLVQDCSFTSHGAGDGLIFTLDNTTVAQFVRANCFGAESGVVPLAGGDDGASLGVDSYGTDAYGTHGIHWPATATVWT